MSEPQETEAVRLTRAEIRRRYDALNAVDKDITARLVAMFQGGGAGVALPARSREVYAVAKRALNGAGGLLKALPTGGESESELYVQRDGIQLAMSTLTQANLEAEAAEAAERALNMLPEWRAVAKEWALAAARFTAVEQAAGALLDKAGGAARHGLPLSGWIGTGAGINHPGLNIHIELNDVLGFAQDENIVTAGELRSARKVGR